MVSKRPEGRYLLIGLTYFPFKRKFNKEISSSQKSIRSTPNCGHEVNFKRKNAFIKTFLRLIGSTQQKLHFRLYKAIQ